MNIERISGLLEGLRQTWHRSKSRRRAMRELASLSPSDLSRASGDVGLSGDDLRHLCRNDFGPSQLLPQRLQQFGIDPEYVRQAAPTTFRDLVRVCASCKACRRCARDLARGDVQAGMGDYCLNGPMLDTLTASLDRRAVH
jgi:hypothetical protein